MAAGRIGILVIFLQIVPICAISWIEASVTSSRSLSKNTLSASEISPHQTPPPYTDVNDTYEPPHLCGYVDYNPWNSYTCGGTATCLWNSHLNLVGCGNLSTINYFTSCIPYRDLRYCDSSCFANPSIIRCGPEVPYCVTPRFGHSGNYSILACQAVRPWGTMKVHGTYSGQNTTGHLPRYLGEDGKITYATRVPRPVSSTTLSPTLTTTFDLDNAYTFLSSTTVYSSETRAAVQISEVPEDQLPERFGLVARVVIGGLAFIVMVATVVAIVVRRRKAMKGGLTKFKLRELDRGVGTERSHEMGAGGGGATQDSTS